MRVTLVEKRADVGRGIAYGACGPQHLLNVPVARMEVGLSPGVAQWLEPRRGGIADAFVESGWIFPPPLYHAGAHGTLPSVFNLRA